jgi:hypothetical protein
MRSNNSAPSAPAPIPPSGVFVSTLTANPRLVTELDDLLREATRLTQEKGGMSKLTLTLEVHPNGLGSGDVPLFRLVDDAFVTPPKKKKRTGQVYFVDEDHNLTRRHPGQGEITLVEVAAPALPEVGAGVTAARAAAQ